MQNTSFREDLIKQISKKNSHICVGLDSDYEKLPTIIKRNASIEDAIFRFNREIIDATQDIVVAYKQNIAFYAGYGIEGLRALQRTNEYVKK